jgi:hypothetical protein
MLLNYKKISGNDIRLDVSSTGSFPFPMSSKCRENTSADWSFRSWTHIFVFNCNVHPCRHNVEYFRQAFISSAGVDREITGYVCLKSPASNINAFPSGWTFPRKSRSDRSSLKRFVMCHRSFIPNNEFTFL